MAVSRGLSATGLPSLTSGRKSRMPLQGPLKSPEFQFPQLIHLSINLIIRNSLSWTAVLVVTSREAASSLVIPFHPWGSVRIHDWLSQEWLSEGQSRLPSLGRRLCPALKLPLLAAPILLCSVRRCRGKLCQPAIVGI